ncbi:Adenylosuccinate lyase [Euphorbia peplus]|nr:Adenylosuccinate lyase [Euphorbia peplus]
MRFPGASPFRVMNSIKKFSSCLPISPPSIIGRPTHLFPPSITSSSSLRPMFRWYYAMRVLLPKSDESMHSHLFELPPLDRPLGNCIQDHLSPYLSKRALSCYKLRVQLKWLTKLTRIPVMDLQRYENVVNVLEEMGIDDRKDGYGCREDWVEQLLLDYSEHISMRELYDDDNYDNYALYDDHNYAGDVPQVLSFFKFASTSEDINNLAHGLMLKDTMNNVVFPMMDKLIEVICKMAQDNASVPMVYRNLELAASVTTLGKELAVYAVRLNKQKQRISKIKIMGKFAGTIGNYNAHFAAYSDIDWPRVAKRFVESLGLCFNPCVSQIEPHDHMAMLFSGVVVFNTILSDFHKDICRYIEEDKLRLRSSTRDFENIEVNLGIASKTLFHLSEKLPLSRWQRDFSDPKMLRDMVVGLGYSICAYETAAKVILEVNGSRLHDDLDESWEMLVEPIQTVMIQYGIPNPHKKLKKLIGGKAITERSIRDFIQKLKLPNDIKTRLLELRPCTYIGASTELANNVVEWLKREPESESESESD